MFCLSLIEHNLPLPPHLLNRPLLDAIKEELERLFLDKVISNLGLCISIYDIRTIEGGFVFPGDGSSTYKVVFRLIMFRPYVGEILCGKLKASDANGLHLSLGFFDDIKVPVHLLPLKSRMGEDGIWIWEHECGDLPMDLDEEVHFRVTKINYPPIPVEQDANANPFSPMEIIVMPFDRERSMEMVWDFFLGGQTKCRRKRIEGLLRLLHSIGNGGLSHLQRPKVVLKRFLEWK